MTLTKRKKIILISSTALILVVAILFSLFWFVWRDEEPEEPVVIVPVETSTLFVMPDEMVFIKDGKETPLSATQISESYEYFVWLESHALDTGTIDGLYSDSYTSEVKARNLCVELRYHQRQKYTGSIGPFRNLEYDALLVVMGGDVPGFIIPYRDSAYQPVGLSYYLLDYYDYDKNLAENSIYEEAVAVTERIKSFYAP